MKIPLAKPRPDFENFLEVLVEGCEPSRPLIMEYVVDEEVRRYVGENLLKQGWVPLDLQDEGAVSKYFLNYIEFWYRMGYDYVRYEENCGFYGVHRMGEDTAELTRGKRSWVEEGWGLISSWDDFEQYRWPEPEAFDLSRYEFLARHLPEGMGFIVSHGAGIFENAVESLLGFEGVCYLLQDDPELVASVFRRTGEIIYEYCRQLLQVEWVHCLFQGDDLGFRTSTFLPPDFLRKHVLPWHAKLAQLAHAKGLPYFLHSCGNLQSIIEDLIETVGIDAKHSYEDAIIPVDEFQTRYGSRVGVLGGVDVNILSEGSPGQVRDRTRLLVETCGSRGRYAIGSGNSIPSYVPAANYLAMVDEAVALGAA